MIFFLDIFFLLLFNNSLQNKIKQQTYFSQFSTNCTSFLWSNIKRFIFFTFIKNSNMCTLTLWNNCIYSCNRFTNFSTVIEARMGVSINVINWFIRDTCVYIFKLLFTNIFVNFDAAPPAIFCTLRLARSCLSSSFFH